MRILVVEDEKKVARFIERGLKEERFAVDVAHDGEAGLELALLNPYDLVVLDVLMPKKDGFQVLAEIRAARRPCRVLMLTARDSVDDRVRGLDNGADDYLTKPFAFAEFLARVRVLVRRGTAEQASLRIADLVLDLKARKVTRAGQPIFLSAKEFAVLEHFVRHAGQVVTRTELAEQVWDLHFDPMTNVIDVTVYHLREKVDRDFKPQLIHTVRGAGYVLKEEEKP
ncbi:MAG: response regulator transcription factor [Verrucomicrobia bacterium]|nr:response regulator transcription factor [Verrucomicrobiota bacterium]